MDKLRWTGSAGGVLLGFVLVLSGCFEAHDVDALGEPVFAGEGGGDGVTGDGDGDGDGDAPGDGDGDGDQCNNCQPSDVGSQFGVTPCCTEDGLCGACSRAAIASRMKARAVLRAFGCG